MILDFNNFSLNILNRIPIHDFLYFATYGCCYPCYYSAATITRWFVGPIFTNYAENSTRFLVNIEKLIKDRYRYLVKTNYKANITFS